MKRSLRIYKKERIIQKRTKYAKIFGINVKFENYFSKNKIHLSNHHKKQIKNSRFFLKEQINDMGKY